MKLDKLVTTTEFIKLIQEQEYHKHAEEKYNVIQQYANFISQKPELWMFVPCDEEGNYIPKVKYTGLAEWDDRYKEHKEEYKQAQERVLFEGWSTTIDEDGNDYIIHKDDEDAILINKIKNVRCTLEDLVVRYYMIPTKECLKQIGLYYGEDNK